MCEDVIAVNIDADIIGIANMIIEKDLYCLPVIQGNKLVGQISRTDVLRAVENFSVDAKL